MRTRVSKLVRGVAGVALLASGLGVVGGVGITLATGGAAGASGGPTDSYTLSCQAPLVGSLSLAATVQDLNTAPASMFEHTTYNAKPQVHVTIPGSLIHVATTEHLTHITVTAGTLTLQLSGFTTNVNVKAHASNVPIVIPVNATTVAHGAVAVVTFATTPLNMTAAATVTATAVPANFTLTVLGLPIPCGSPGQTYPGTTLPYTGTSTATPIVSIKSLGIEPLALAPASGALPGATATVRYVYNTVHASGGTGGDVFTPSTFPAWLHLTQTGSNTAKITGTPPATAATTTVPVDVSVKDNATVTVTHTYTIAVGPAPSTPKLLQPFKVTLTPGTLTMTCGTTTPLTTPTHGLPVETQADAHTCNLLTFGTHKLNETNQVVTVPEHTIFISTARGGTTDDWTLEATMVPTTTSLTHNPFCNTVPGFCNATTTNLTRLEHHYINTTILPLYLSKSGYTCKPNQNEATPYYNSNPTPTNTGGGSFGPGGAHGTNPVASAVVTLCSAATGSSGGEFIVTGGTYTLILPPNIYIGTYYGTVQYTLVAST